MEDFPREHLDKRPGAECVIGAGRRTVQAVLGRAIELDKVSHLLG